MTKIDLLTYLRQYTSIDKCECLVAYLNKLTRGRDIVFAANFSLSPDNQSLLNTDSDTYHVVFVDGHGYTYIRNDDQGILRCALAGRKTGSERTVYFAKTPEEFCNVAINRIILR